MTRYPIILLFARQLPFDSHRYLEEYYRDITTETYTLLEFLVNTFRTLPPIDRALEFGCGHPAALAAARDWLMDIRPHVIFVEESDTASTVPYITSGEAVIALNAGVREAIEAREAGAAVEWIMPTAGALLWGDNFAIPTASQNQARAHLFIDFLLRPENGATLAEWNQYATPNDAALPLMDPTIATNPLIYPSFDTLSNVEVVLPVSTDANQRYLDIWNEFVAGRQ